MPSEPVLRDTTIEQLVVTDYHKCHERIGFSLKICGRSEEVTCEPRSKDCRGEFKSGL
jgi:hypothetical protein